MRQECAQDDATCPQTVSHMHWFGNLKSDNNGSFGQRLSRVFGFVSEQLLAGSISLERNCSEAVSEVKTVYNEEIVGFRHLTSRPYHQLGQDIVTATK